MKVKMIEESQKMNLETDNNDMREELNARFEHAAEIGMDELDFFMELLECGITLDDIKEFLPDGYEYSKVFMEDHGLM